jgi:Fur family ferric uptake transcriptional regulator
MFIHSTHPSIIQNWLDCLQASGYRLTGPRRAVVKIMAETCCIMNPTEVFLEARKDHKDISLVTVYRTLEKLEECNLIQRVHHPDGCQAFAPASIGHQHHLLCLKCGRVELFDGDDLDQLIHQITNRTGYKIQDHWLELFGVCSFCQKEQTSGI